MLVMPQKYEKKSKNNINWLFFLEKYLLYSWSGKRFNSIIAFQ